MRIEIHFFRLLAKQGRIASIDLRANCFYRFLNSSFSMNISRRNKFRAHFGLSDEKAQKKVDSSKGVGIGLLHNKLKLKHSISSNIQYEPRVMHKMKLLCNSHGQLKENGVSFQVL